MKIFFLILSFFMFSKAYALEWPSGLFKADTLQQQFFTPFKNYFVQVIESHAIQPKNGGLIIFDEGEVELEIDWVQNAGILSLFYRSKNSELVIFVESEGELNVSEIALLNFDSLFSSPSYRLDIPKLNYSLSKKTRGNSVNLTFSPAWGNIFFEQKITRTELESRMWYNCSECSGEPILFRQIEAGVPTFFVGELVQSVSPQRYLSIANRFYLSGISSQSSTLLSQLKSSYSFPSIGD
ncbi:MAG: hypothetical protein CME65_05975 [Halobacteriovoraceae bacterium]|nr:hypothetical protein [Halobacteriovoraceae bacterium]|tara:strand:+ start:20641 stop:21357 length:717 start_codon:yes stop_codon:yes gene_type:complete